jgi:hypothetical protein
MNTQTNRWKGRGANSTMGQTMEQVSSAVGQCREQTDRMVSEYPASAAMLTFSIGCCLGLMTAMLAFPVRRHEPQHWYDRVWHR